MVDLVDSVFAGSLDLYDVAMDFDDLAFMNLILCMEEADQALSARLQDIRALNDRKKAINERIAYLNDALANAGNDKKVSIVGGLNGEQGQAASQGHDDLSYQADGQESFYEHPLEGREIQGEYTKEQVQAAIDRLRGELEDLNTSSSVLLVDLNRLMGKRQEAVQLTSNIISKSHETAMSLINNIGR